LLGCGNVFLGNSVVNGNINLRNANIDGSFFFGHGKVMGELNMEKSEWDKPRTWWA